VWAGTTAADREHLARRLRAGEPAARVLNDALETARLPATNPPDVVLEDVA
jgi:hypothetical protein